MADRYDRRRRDGTVNLEFRGLTPAEQRLMDAKAELAERYVADVIGADPSPIDRRTVDHGVDLITRDGRSLDVKQTDTTPGMRFGALGIGYPTLKVSTWRRHPYRAELYVMVCGATAEDMWRYQWAHGYATREQIMAAPIDPGRYGRPFHWIGFDHLRPLAELLTD